jgi:predicted MFS family arabinose efflux permease
VPLGLVGFGIGALAGTLVGGRIGDVSPHATTIAAPAATTVLLLAICLLSGFAAPMIALVVLLGLFGLGANPAARARSSPCSPPRRGHPAVRALPRRRRAQSRGSVAAGHRVLQPPEALDEAE